MHGQQNMKKKNVSQIVFSAAHQNLTSLFPSNIYSDESEVLYDLHIYTLIEIFASFHMIRQ